MFAHLPARQGESTELTTQDCVCSSPTTTGRKYRTLNTRLCLLISHRDREKAQNSQHKTVFAHLPPRQGESTELATQDCVCSSPSATGRKYRTLNTRLCLLISHRDREKAQNSQHKTVFAHLPARQGESTELSTQDCVCSSPSATGRKHRTLNTRLCLLISQRDREKVQNSQHKTVFARLPPRQGESTELSTQDCVCSSPSVTGRKYRTLNTRLCLLISQCDREKAQNSQHKTVFAHLPPRQGESTELTTQDCVCSSPSVTGRKHRTLNTRQCLLVSQCDREKAQNSQHKTVFARLPV